MIKSFLVSNWIRFSIKCTGHHGDRLPCTDYAGKKRSYSETSTNVDAVTSIDGPEVE